MIEKKSGSRQETEAWGAALGKRLVKGDVVTLSGAMGAGKTVFVNGLVRSLGYAEGSNSPTFALAHEYPTDPPVVHMDACRLKDSRDFQASGMEEYLQGDCVCLLEWPETGIPFLPASRLDILIRGNGDEERTILFRPMGSDWTKRLENFDIEDPHL